MSPIEKARILVVDDDKAWREAMSLILKPLGIAPILLRSGEDAIEYLRTNKVDVIVTDTNMPGITGIQLLEQIRKTDRHIPVIVFFSGLLGADISADEVLAMGATAVLSKSEAAFQLLHLLTDTIMNQENK